MCGYADPTPIQAYACAAIKMNYDMIGVAQTGQSKHACVLKFSLTFSQDLGRQVLS